MFEYKEDDYVSQIHIPVHPLGLMARTARVIFEAQGWTEVEMRHTHKQTFLIFERPLNDETAFYTVMDPGKSVP